MVATMTQEKQVPAEAPKEIPKDQLAVAGQVLTQGCHEIELNVNWYTTSKQLASALRQKMADAIGADAKALSLAKRIFDSGHPLVKAANSAKSALTEYVYSKSMPRAEIPVVAFMEGNKTGKKEENTAEALLRKAAGRRLVFDEDIDDLCQQVQVHTVNIQRAVKKLDDNLEAVKKHDAEKLGTGFCEDDYPETIADAVNVHFDIREVGLSVDFEQSCPKAAAMLKEMAYKRTIQDVQLIVGDFAKTFLGIVETVANQLGNKMEVAPRPKHPLRFLKGGFVKEIRTHKEDPEIPEGQRALLVQYMPDDEKGKKGARKIEEWFGPFDEDEFKDLNLTPTDQKNAVHESTMKALLGQLEVFQTVVHKLGDAAKPLGGIVQEIHEIFHSAGDREDDILKEMKESGFFRKNAQAALQKAAVGLESVITTVPIKPPRRRAIGKLRKTAKKPDEK